MRTFFSFLLATSFCGCATYRVSTGVPVAEAHNDVFTEVLWGSSGDVVRQDCGSKGLAYVEVHADPASVFFSFVTLGMFSYHTVRYACAQ